MNRFLTISVISFFAISILFALQSCDSKKTVLKDVPEDKLDKSYTVKLNEKLVIKLAANPTTGFKWSLESKIKPKIIKEIKKEYIKDMTMGIIGSGGHEEWTFETKKAGVLFMHFKYLKESGETDKEKYLKITVTE